MNAMEKRILFVCMGNICRSPAAECVFHAKIKELGHKKKVLLDSAGTTAYHTGEAPDRRMQEELRKRGIPVFGSARPVVAEDFQKFDLILAMDRSNLHDLRKRAPVEDHRADIRLFGEFCQKTPNEDIPDPYYGGRDGFVLVADRLEDGCEGLWQYLCESLEKEEDSP